MTNLPSVTAGDRLTMTDLIHEFFWNYDRHRADEVLALFTEDGLLSFGTGARKTGSFTGPALRQFMVDRAARRDMVGRHTISNSIFVAEGADAITCRSVITVLRFDAETNRSNLAGVADLEASFVRQVGAWRISRFEITPLATNS